MILIQEANDIIAVLGKYFLEVPRLRRAQEIIFVVLVEKDADI
jgi:hypothetical protein